MSKTFAITVERTTTESVTILVRADDKYVATDKAYDFAKLHELKDRYVTTGRELTAYASKAIEVGSTAVDVEA